ncbi:uncharacterized protein LOC122374162 [Amphibalanus amphitrite]|uniref:uncharacterized protein LOC122374162 n=1 Tax=Amphibalanus amphitrite TaxID=1232801 RepID=UPI001C92573B|nr:uncharacterized protein LOC122374162 [Amphibalanus amphitrite]
MYARLQMASALVLPAGSSVSLRYWLRTDYPGSGTLEVRRQVDGVEEKEPLLSLTNTSGPNSTQWAEVSVPIPDSSRPQKIIIFGGCANHEQNNIAVDDVTICGPMELNQECNSLTTTTELTTITEDPTTRWTEDPTTRWTEDPTTRWTEDPTTRWTEDPTTRWTEDPTTRWTEDPTTRWTEDPTTRWTEDPTTHWTEDPTTRWTEDPTTRWTEDPTTRWTEDPTTRWTEDPTTRWTEDPTTRWTEDPTTRWTEDPTTRWTEDPTTRWTEDPTTRWTEDPTTRWTEDPTTRWTEDPTTRWTEDPTTRWTPTTPAPVPGEYCDDFESDDFGLFWRQSRWDSGGHWEQSAFSRLRDTVPDFPAPASGDWLVFLTPAAGSSFAAARLQMTAELVFPAGSRLSFRYWLRSQVPAGAALFVKRCVGEEEDRESLLDLSETAAPGNDRWTEVSVAVPADPRPAKIIIFGSRGTQPLDSIAIDDIRICGPEGLDHQCLTAAPPRLG